MDFRYQRQLMDFRYHGQLMGFFIFCFINFPIPPPPPTQKYSSSKFPPFYPPPPEFVFTCFFCFCLFGVSDYRFVICTFTPIFLIDISLVCFFCFIYFLHPPPPPGPFHPGEGSMSADDRNCGVHVWRVCFPGVRGGGAGKCREFRILAERGGGVIWWYNPISLISVMVWTASARYNLILFLISSQHGIVLRYQIRCKESHSRPVVPLEWASQPLLSSRPRVTLVLRS